MAAKRAPSAYFIFANEHRSAARADCAAEAGTDKVSVAQVAKVIGRRWKALTDEERSTYKAQAEDRARQDQLARDKGEVLGERPCSADPGRDQPNDEAERPFSLFPLSLVKRIMCLDEDVKRVAAESIKAVARAAELFLEDLAEQSFTEACKHKRRTIKFVDVQRAVAGNPHMVQMGLKDLLAHDDLFEEIRNGQGEGGKAKRQKSNPADLKGVLQISNFFVRNEQQAA